MSRKRFTPKHLLDQANLNEIPMEFDVPTKIGSLQTIFVIVPLVSESEPAWKTVHLLHNALSLFGLEWMGFVDSGNLIILDEILARRTSQDLERWVQRRLAGLICEQIDAGGTTIGLDVKRMLEHRKLSIRVAGVLELRKSEMENVEVRIDAKGRADLQALWLTAYGHSVLSAMRLGTKCSTQELVAVKNALGKLGFSLKVTKGKLAMPSNISEPLREYVWRLANFRAKEKKQTQP